MIKELITINVVMSAIVQACKNKIILNNIHWHIKILNNIHEHLKMSMNLVGEGEPMHNHKSGWEEEALENCVGAVRCNIIPKSQKDKFDFPYSGLFQVKTGNKFSPLFSDRKGYIAIQIIYTPNGLSYNIIGITVIWSYQQVI